MPICDSASANGGDNRHHCVLSSLEIDDEEELVYPVTVNGYDAQALLDSGASHCFISPEDAQKMQLSCNDTQIKTVELANGNVIECKEYAQAHITMDGWTYVTQVHVVPGLNKGTIVLGRNWLRNCNPSIDWEQRNITITRKDGSKATLHSRNSRRSSQAVRIKQISIKRASVLVRKKGFELFAVKMQPTTDVMKVSPECREVVEKYSDIFVSELPQELPPERDVEFEINLKSDQPPPARPVIRLSTNELKELKKQLEELLSRGLLRPSSSPYGAPVFFVKKKEGDLRMVCDYRALNKITIPDSNPLPLIDEALDQVAGAKVFSKIDLIGAYHQMRIKQEDCQKTAIRTRFGSFEWRVLTFGLTNAPASFTRLLSTLLRNLNGECLVMFLDDVLVYSASMEEHKKHLERLFAVLRANKLYAKKSKCVVGASEVDFVGYTVNEEGISTQKRLVKAIETWPVPTSVREIQRFMGLTNFYRKFVFGYSRILQPISDLVRTRTFIWGKQQQEAFDTLKGCLTSSPVLVHPDSTKRFTVSTDASQYAVGATLSQEGHPVAYLSHRLSDTEERWDTGDQELLAFMIALREWRVYLYGRSFSFETDHEPLRYLQTKARLSGRQKRWLDELQEHNYDCVHVSGTANGAADALSRRPDFTTSLKIMSTHYQGFIDRITNGYQRDNWAKSLLNVLRDEQEPANSKVQQAVPNYKFQEGFLLWTGTDPVRRYVPDVETLRNDLIESHHAQAHLGIEKTFYSMARFLYWPNMHAAVVSFVSNCRVCQTNKRPNQKPQGLLQPHDIPVKTWDVVTADFLTELPRTDSGNDTILVIVDKLSKRGIFIPTTKDIDAAEVAQLFQDHLFSKQGTPTRIISDRDPKFKSNFWRSLNELKNVKLNLSTADHPETDGQSEVMIRTVANMLRPAVQNDRATWDKMLSQMEYEYNASVNASTKLTPFEVDIGRIPENPLSRSLAVCSVQNQTAAEFIERIDMFRRIARDNLAAARSAQKHHADKKRQDVSFNKGDLALLDTRSLDLVARSDLPKKWRPRYLGPLRIREVMGPVTYRIELPPTMKRAHNVFHVSKLKKYNGDKDVSDLIPITVDADGTQEFEVKAIVGKKKQNRRIFFLVQFEGKPREEAIWLPKTELQNCKELVEEYERSMRTSNSKRR